MTNIIKNFIGIFPNAASKEYCDKVIHRFEYLNELRSDGRGKIWTRQEAEDGISKLAKEDNTHFLSGTSGEEHPLTKEETKIMQSDASLLREFDKAIWLHYDKFTEEYRTLRDLAFHKISPAVRLQKYEPSQGYHLWHCDTGNLMTARRLIAVILYLNTVEEGGETEFLYQHERISPVQGTLVLFPAGWTHPHRGNPPLKGNKYILTSWIELVE